MIECPIPQDVLKYKSKFIMNLSVRETVFGALGIGLGLMCYFGWTKDIASRDLKMLLSFLVIMPFFLIGFVKIYDQPFEKMAITMVRDNFIYPAKRRKEVHHPEFEKYEKERFWMSSTDTLETDDEDLKDTGKKKNKNVLPLKKNTSPKVKIVKSDIYKGIK